MSDTPATETAQYISGPYCLGNLRDSDHEALLIAGSGVPLCEVRLRPSIPRNAARATLHLFAAAPETAEQRDRLLAACVEARRLLKAHEPIGAELRLLEAIEAVEAAEKPA